MQTNRELYGFVADLAARHRVGQRSLEAYLRAMWGLVHAGPARATWQLDEFAELLAASFVAPEPNVEAAIAIEAGSASFDQWQQVILEQVADLHGMREAGLLAQELRYYGLDAPSGARWYNFDACSYLEAGAVGAFGGLTIADERVIAIDWEGFVRFLVAGASYE
ncbi:hypothetical protein ACNOYE_13215 [Nannocystaceae bacterium ST9]